MTRIVGEDIAMSADDRAGPRHDRSGSRRDRADPDEPRRQRARCDAERRAGSLLETTNTIVDEPRLATHLGVAPGRYVVLCGQRHRVRHVRRDPRPRSSSRSSRPRTSTRAPASGLATVFGIVKQAAAASTSSPSRRSRHDLPDLLAAHRCGDHDDRDATQFVPSAAPARS